MVGKCWSCVGKSLTAWPALAKQAIRMGSRYDLARHLNLCYTAQLEATGSQRAYLPYWELAVALADLAEALRQLVDSTAPLRGEGRDAVAVLT